MSNFDEIAIKNFRDYLRIPTVHPNINYDPCVEFLKQKALELNLPVKICSPVPKKPIVIISWIGSNPELPAILLNSHTDVVPVFEESWTYPPFEGYMHENGDIYGRGAQDMKCVGIMYLEAIRRLKSKGITLKRSLHLSFVPDEEIGGSDGMETFVKTKDFKNLNIGFSLDEGLITPLEEYVLFYGEKAIWQIHVHCCGTPAHGSDLSSDTPGEKFRYIINKFLDLRDEMKAKNASSRFPDSDVTSINLTKVYGGVQENVVPEKLTAVFDLRIALSEDLNKFEAMMNQWCKEAGSNVYIEFKQKGSIIPATKIDDSNPFWTAMKSIADKLDLKLKSVICPGNTDSRYLRKVGIPALGFTPINKTPMLLHGHDERVNKDAFLKGIGIYCEILTAVANV